MTRLLSDPTIILDNSISIYALQLLGYCLFDASNIEKGNAPILGGFSNNRGGDPPHSYEYSSTQRLLLYTLYMDLYELKRTFHERCI